MAAIEALVQPWRDTAIAPLRAARRGIKTLPEMADDDVAALRKDVAALELRAEQIEHAMLYRVGADARRRRRHRRRRGDAPQRFSFGSWQGRARARRAASDRSRAEARGDGVA